MGCGDRALPGDVVGRLGVGGGEGGGVLAQRGVHFRFLLLLPLPPLSNKSLKKKCISRFQDNCVEYLMVHNTGRGE